MARGSGKPGGRVMVGGARHLTPRERAERGKAARKRTPRSAHAGFEPAPGRPDPVAVVEEQSAARVQELIPIRYGRMTQTPFRFYRGAAAVMAQDLAATPDSGLTVQLCGDAHMLNFRLLGSPERRLVFDINDFDETLRGPWEWDLQRLAASLVIAARENGWPRSVRARIVQDTVRSYRERMRAYAGMGNLDVWYDHGDMERVRLLADERLGARGRGRLAKALGKARTRDSLQAFEKLTAIHDGRRRFTPDPPLIVPVDDLLSGAELDRLVKGLRQLVERYVRSLAMERRHLLRQYRVVDIARKVVGVGSVGTRCWILLLLGKDDQDPLILQAKEADRSVLAEHLGESAYDNQGKRVVAGQRLMQAVGDVFLGWDRVTDVDVPQRDFYVRQLHDWKGIVEPQDMVPKGMRVFGELCGATLARAHARSGDRIAIAAYLGGGDVLDRALAVFAEDYADQNERDHRALVTAVRKGRVTAAGA
ncbi:MULTISPECIES: DUF2252 domain-containing protein [unclassified Streptomyces]|uniref:DUF2252 domain-containing protein n=1 Tax=unclassified Streptomyces TaxID=2593676 RepID=UPI00082386B9|nr:MULTISPECIES: DUF2252 domain-containing protein [unclassified Streptomyces]SCK04972.1 Uncharacterized conserved protein, DUF2252 family [Streptomyces sp. AmelKG-E11A]